LILVGETDAVIVDASKEEGATVMAPEYGCVTAVQLLSPLYVALNVKEPGVWRFVKVAVAVAQGNLPAMSVEVSGVVTAVTVVLVVLPSASVKLMFPVGGVPIPLPNRSVTIRFPPTGTDVSIAGNSMVGLPLATVTVNGPAVED
jgi:hypothetical protein